MFKWTKVPIVVREHCLWRGFVINFNIAEGICLLRCALWDRLPLHTQTDISLSVFCTKWISSHLNPCRESYGYHDFIWTHVAKFYGRLRLVLSVLGELKISVYRLWFVSRLFNVTINDISVVYVTAHRCAGGLKKKLNLRSGSQRHRHFVGFFNVPVQAPTRGHPFYTVIPKKKTAHLVAFNDTLGRRRSHSRLKPRVPRGDLWDYYTIPFDVNLFCSYFCIIFQSSAIFRFARILDTSHISRASITVHYPCKTIPWKMHVT